MNWSWKKFADLTQEELYEILSLRQEVFIVEQKCRYQDIDGKDPQAWHLAGRENEKLQAYLRAFPPGIKHAEASIGRVVSAPSARGTGMGRSLMTEALKCLENEMGKTPIRISAQSYLEKFYQSFGFKTVSAPYLEDDIPHVEMLRK